MRGIRGGFFCHEFHKFHKKYCLCTNVNLWNPWNLWLLFFATDYTDFTDFKKIVIPQIGFSILCEFVEFVAAFFCHGFHGLHSGF
jgi:hypothetical protein